MSFSEAVKDGFDHYAKFDGRASRSSFWWWVLFVIIVGFVCNIIDAAIFDTWILTWITSVALFLPYLSKAIRRLHDTGRTGWWVLIGITGIGLIVLLIFYLEKGDEGANEYGQPETAAAPAPAA